ncbi:MAG: hypothetical protein A2V66_04295 [Ignavibacteria bacterium RBG_13_36_8]|nr:MAG: hypothetical protein A2V66_04295 [Ignavibacteria bacterium RBG_13_36_8]
MKILRYLFFIIILTTVSVLYSQDVRNTLFQEADKVLETAKQSKADILSPNNYKSGLEYYKDADEGLKSGENIDNIRTDLEKSLELLKKSIEVANLAKDVLKELINARNDAESVSAPFFAPDVWEDGTDKFTSAAEELEDGNIKDAQSIAKEAIKYFRDAELKAIKLKLLGPIIELHNKAEELSVEDFATITLSKSKLLLQQAESELNDNRYNNIRAEEMADEAKYEAQHAIYMTRLFNEMIEKNKTWEDIKLASELPFMEIGAKYGFKVRFDNGYETAKNKIIENMESRNEEIKNMKDEKQNLEKRLDEVEKTITNLQNEIESIQNTKTLLEQKLAQIEKEEEDFRNVTSLFSISEADILRDGKNILIRLSSLNFDAGKSVIDPQYFNLLSKVQKAIMMFPSGTFTIEGHTDSQGSTDINLKLSQDRADAVRQYLLANLEINFHKILSISYGDTKPIANNETEEGRRKNRRIDIVINPYGVE